MGFNAQWGQPWGTNHPGPWVKDPRPWLNAILNGSGGAPNTTDTSGAPLPNCGVDPICLLNNWWISSVGPTLKMWGEYIAIFLDRKSTRLNSSHTVISYAVFCLEQ